MRKTKLLGIHVISYYNIILSIVLIYGSITLIVFSRTGLSESKQVALLPSLLVIISSMFFIFSSNQYLQHKNVGRICLIYSCLIQILFSIHGAIGTFRAIGEMPLFNIITLVVALWGTYYLTTKEAKDWAKK